MQKIIISAVALMLVIGAIVFIKGDSKQNPVLNESTNTASSTITTNTDTATASTTGSVASSTVKTYKMSDIAMHKDSSSCWTAISGEVFDLTTWIKQHPGGDKAILSICGIDGTKAFEGQHGGKAKIEMKLETFKIGNLSK